MLITLIFLIFFPTVFSTFVGYQVNEPTAALPWYRRRPPVPPGKDRRLKQMNFPATETSIDFRDCPVRYVSHNQMLSIAWLNVT